MRAARQGIACDPSSETDADTSAPAAVPLRPPSRRFRAQEGGTCRVCTRPSADDLVDAGGDIGVVHHACFVLWDRRQEALEQMLAKSHGFEHQAEDSMDTDPGSGPSPTGEATAAHAPFALQVERAAA